MRKELEDSKFCLKEMVKYETEMVMVVSKV